MEYSKLADTYQQLESTQKNHEKRDILAELFNESGEELPRLVLLCLGKPYPDWKNAEIGISSNMMVEIVSQATGHSEERVEELWKEKGDLGSAAEELVKNKKQQRLMAGNLTVEKVIDRIRKVCDMEKQAMSQSVDQGKKKSEIADLISSADPLEARYVTRTVLRTLRLGVAEGTVRDALDHAFLDGENAEEIQRAYNMTNDFEKVAEASRDGVDALRELEMELFRPIKSMLAKKVETLEEGFEEVGEPAAIDYKYDGMRAQIHIRGDEVKVFTRRLENVTEQFPDVVEAVKKHMDLEEGVIDAEIVAYDPETHDTIPFQKLSKRIRRKYEIQKLKEEIPVEVRPFDLLHDGEPLIEEPYQERWEKLNRVIEEEDFELRPVDHATTSDREEVHELQHEALEDGHEGIMMKNLEAEYKPGNRVGYMVKLKPTMETLDLAVIGAKWSEGRRSDWLGRLYLGCYDEENDEYLEVGKMATGLTDEQFQKITEKLEPLITSEDGRKVEVRPEVILEVEYEEIQESPNYTSGYALRFPRMKAFRDDKEEADSLEKVKSLYEDQ
jgi:DNA ligase-1